ncbi:hypothetical protein [Dyadobacter tibetensis]|uniref:hypothetical protein n=1 Tax=Dyadobacter tibetensis TaxID=1211851 RepID=UPI00046F6578|nr:hypothetical protein [Dyadobacter tibetensis]
MKLYFYLICMFLITASCSQKKEQVQELEQQVLSIHDEVMAYMDQIMTMKGRINKELATIDSLENEGIADNQLAQQRLTLTQLNSKLDESDAEMMQWMQRFNGDSAKNLKAKEAIIYFESEKEKISRLKQNTEKNLEEVKSYLDL